MKKKYVLVDGMYRSGTSVMMRLFDGVPSCLVLPFEDGILRAVYHHKNEFDKTFKTRDFLRLRNCLCHIKYWDLEKVSDREFFSFRVPKEAASQVEFDFKEFDADFKNRMNGLEEWSLENFVDAFFGCVSENINLLPDAETVSHFFMKTPISTPAIPLFLKTFEDAFVIYLIRDPRATYVSVMKFGGKTIPLIDGVPRKHLNNWQKNVKSIMNLTDACKNRIRIVKYEDLITHTEDVMKGLSQFLCLEYSEALCKPTLLGLPWYGYSSHVHRQKGIDEDAAERWKECYDDQIRDAVCFFLDPNIRKRFGYDSGGHQLRNLAFCRIVIRLVILRHLSYVSEKVLEGISALDLRIQRLVRRIFRI